MLDPHELYHLTPAAQPRSRGWGQPVMLCLLEGFLDAGSVGQIATTHLLEELEHEVVAQFDVDQLHDYRSRRPVMLFEDNKWATYSDPALRVHRLHDEQGTSFLLLEGPEPDIQWERFVAAAISVVQQLNARLVVGLTGIPVGVPHTRPPALTLHQTRPDLVTGYAPWVQSIQVPGSAANLLEFRLGQHGHDALGFAVHVPHYLTGSDYPLAAEVGLEAVSRATGLALPTASLREAAQAVRTAIDEQVTGSAEVAAVVAELEQQYDQATASRAENLPNPEIVPSADELGAQFERFLAEHDKRNPGRGLGG